MVLKVLILDGYTDEPAGLGVPPYIDVYPRYIAGAVWSVCKDAIVKYVTIDEARRDWSSFFKEARNSNYVIVIAGVIVPGRYIGGNPLTPQEALWIAESLPDKFTILAGPAARFGMGVEGGVPATPPKKFKKVYKEIVTGDPEVYVADLIRYGEEKAESWRRRESYDEIENYILKGALIVLQHPNHNYNLTVELESYRGCSRWVVGGCSFCIEPLYGKPVQRRVESIVREAEILYKLGVRSFRLGRQSDILVYGSRELGLEEYPRPNPEVIEKLFRNLRVVIGDSNLHIDNVNPGTIVAHKRDSIEALKAIVKYHSPGDVAAMGLESADEKVVKINNLNINPDEALDAIRVVNRIGGLVGWNGMPHLLPGINFVLGLPGETKETFYKNIEFLDRVIHENLAVRRINIREVMVIPGTRLSSMWSRSIIYKHKRYFRWFKWVVRQKYDKVFIKRVAPKGRILRYVFVEKQISNHSIGRQLGSYPLTIEIRGRVKPPKVVDVVVEGHKSRSVKARILC